MNFPLFIARRYLFSKKNFNIINIISAVAIAGITFATAALLVILSIFNGLELLISDLMNTFNPDIKAELKQGKYFPITDSLKKKLDSSPYVAYYSFVLEENAVLEYRDMQTLAVMLGADENLKNVSGVDTMLFDGIFMLKKNPENYAVVGYGIADKLGISVQDFYFLRIWAAKKTSSEQLNFQNDFNSGSLRVAGIFSIQDDFDSKYVIVPYDFAENLLERENMATSVWIKIFPDKNIEEAKKKLKKIFGEKFYIKNRFEQEETLYKIMKSERWAIFAILTFILFVSSFNIAGSMIMLIIEKKHDIGVLISMGASEKTVRRIFVLEGILISFIGAVAGILLGLLLCYLQIKFSLITFPSGSVYIAKAYPVKIKAMDIPAIFFTVLFIGYLIAQYPVKFVTSKIFKTNK